MRPRIGSKTVTLLKDYRCRNVKKVVGKTFSVYKEAIRWHMVGCEVTVLVMSEYNVEGGWPFEKEPLELFKILPFVFSEASVM